MNASHRIRTRANITGSMTQVLRVSTALFFRLIKYLKKISNLKTHFGLHNTLMTLSSLEIRNCGALRISYRYGACNGVIKISYQQNLENQSFWL